MTVLRQQAVIALPDREAQQRRRRAAAVDKQVLLAAVAAVERGKAHQAAYADGAVRHPHRPQVIEIVRPEEVAQPVGERIGAARRQTVQVAAVNPQAHADFRVRQGLHDEPVAQVGQLGLLAAQELAPRRYVEEEIAHVDAGARRAADVVHVLQLAGRNHDFGAVHLALAAGREPEARHGRDGRQGFAAKAKRVDVLDIVNVAYLAGGMPLDGQQRVVAVQARAVVAHGNQLAAAGSQLDIDLRGAGINGVFGQLFQSRCRPLHDLAGGDLVGHRLRKHADILLLRHGVRVRAERKTCNAQRVNALQGQPRITRISLMGKEKLSHPCQSVQSVVKTGRVCGYVARAGIG